MQIGKYNINHSIIQGGMGIGISWDKLAGNVSLEGGLGVVSSVGTGYYHYPQYLGNSKSDRPNDKNFCSPSALNNILKNAKNISDGAPIATNIMVALSDYKESVVSACKSGTNIIISGAGIPGDLPKYTADYPDVALVPIVSSLRALKIVLKKWSRYNKVPDAIVVEGPKSGGHQGFSYEQCFMKEYQLENILPDIIEYVYKLNIPVIAAGGIWDKNDIDSFMEIGCSGVQMGTRFIATHECDAPRYYKDILLKTTQKDIKLGDSPVGLPSRRIITNLHSLMEKANAPIVKCTSNCVSPCNRGVEARKVGYCIADRLADAITGNIETGLFFSGTNGYRVNEIISVHELMQRLINGE